jgi:2-dehydro-3-deoxyphosphooctonate aldolase (KDO 8-P synthase)
VIHMQRALQLGEMSISNDAPMVLVGGLNVLESETLALETADAFSTCCAKLGIPYIFKASFDKANRSSKDSYRGPGLKKGLKILDAVKQKYNVPLLTDLHEPDQAAPVAEIVDIIQLPAFLSRQTDLVVAMAETKAFINIK